MLQRRKFLKESTAFALGGLFFSNQSIASLFKPANHALGVQLFTFFTVIDEDVKGTLQKIAAVGYTEIESAFSKKGGYYGMKSKEFSAMLKDLGLVWTSHHVLGAPFKLPPGAKMPLDVNGKPMVLPAMHNLRENLQQLVDEAAEGGIKYLVCASTPISTLNEIHTSIDILNKTGEACKKAGIQFIYHNHDAEFRSVEGQIPYEIILTQTSTDLVKMELDLAWAVKGGKDPIELFKQNPGRFPLWHLKDLDAKHETILPVGSGTIDFIRIFDNAKLSGLQHLFIEHDMPADALASITSSFNYLNKTLNV